MADASSDKMPGPESFETLKGVIAKQYPELSGQLKRIAEFAVENPNDIALKTVAAIADDIGVQPSSMVRFAKSFGYEGFSDLQKIFRSRLISSSPDYAERIQSFRHDRGDAGTVDLPDHVLSDFVDQGKAALDLLRTQMAPGSIEKAVEILANANDIYLLAQRRSFPVAFFMSYALSRFDQRCILIDGIGGLLEHQASLAMPSDALVAVSFRPYAPSVADVVRDRAQSGVPIIAITDSALSPLANNAAVSFEIKEYEERGFRSLVAPMCLAQSIVVSLGHHIAAQCNGTPRK